MSLYKRYRQYAEGGSVEDQNMRSNQALGLGDGNAALGALSTVTTAMSGLADRMDPVNEYGRQRTSTHILKDVPQLGAIGVLTGIVKGNKEKREEKILKQQEQGLAYNHAVSKYKAMAAADPTVATGTRGEELYAEGGNLHSQYLQKKMGSKGSLSRISSDTVEVKGPSHAQGGVDLDTGDEVEGGETIKGSYVMSKKNGFADLHKPLAKAIGVLEKKAMTIATTNSLQRLRDKEDALILFQEQYNKQHNL